MSGQKSRWAYNVTGDTVARRDVPVRQVLTSLRLVTALKQVSRQRGFHTGHGMAWAQIFPMLAEELSVHIEAEALDEGRHLTRAPAAGHPGT